MVVVAFSACGAKPSGPCDPDQLAAKAQLCPDRLSLGFGLEFNRGEFIGTSPIDNFVLRNGGVEDLVFNSVIVNGDSAFKYTASWDSDPNDATIPGATVKANQVVLVQVEFTPRAAKLYTGSLKIVSNAQNTPDLTLQVSGCGVPADGGTSPCYRDGGVR
jgi:hypothetical protein